MLDTAIRHSAPNSAERSLERPKTHATGASKKAQCGQALERIIEASRHEFMAIGPAAARIDSIAARASLTRQSVYYYYKNKEEIFYDIVVREAHMMVDQFANLDMNSTTPEATIKELLLGLLDNANQAPILSVFVSDQVCFPGSDKRATAIFTNLMQQIAGRLQILLDRGAEQGTLRPGVDAARFLAAACMITSGAKHNRHALQITCGIDVDDEEGMGSWQVFAVDLLMRSIRAAD
ncbi:MAG: TetR/AcrR family transcriptional regulator [Caulobacterales bacterium]|nr:TetR/AcrR family transcriptional regulator [Caulobacterales bacterium]